MGPLIPQGFVNPDLNLFFAFVIGLGFGYVLEQGGFSNSKKLAGVFYGYDFVVLRVFFTAAITAAIGLLLFSYMGWVEYDMLYVNPTFLWSAIVGGIIMGFGFILGGYCPGTSMVGAVIGKIDAMFFVFGLMAGVFFFGSFYESFKPLYEGNNLGDLMIYDTLSMGRDWFVFALVVIALAAFIITRKIEDRVNGIQDVPKGLFHPSYTAPFSMMLFLAVLLLYLPDSPRGKWYELKAEAILTEAASAQHYAPVNEVAYKLLHESENDLMLIDVRDAEAFTRFSLPGSVNLPLKEVLGQKAERLLENKIKSVVLFSYSATNADQAWLLLRRAGYENIRVLDGGLNGFFAHIFGEKTETKSILEEDQFDIRFRQRAQEAFKSGEAAVKINAKASPVTTIVEIEPPKPGKGGC